MRDKNENSSSVWRRCLGNHKVINFIIFFVLFIIIFLCGFFLYRKLENVKSDLASCRSSCSLSERN